MAAYTRADRTALAGASKTSMGYDVVTGILDTLNSTTSAGGTKKNASSIQAAVCNTYDFNKRMLLAANYGKGAIISITD